MIDKFGKNILTLFRIGYFKYAPGTAASLITTFIYLTLFIQGINVWILIFIYFIILIFTPNLIDKNINKFSSKDPKEIVIDEFLGQSIPCILICYKLKVFGALDGAQRLPEFIPSLVPFSVAFISFRVFDIFKPFPINLIDKKMKNGFGVILDDIVAGVYSLVVTYLFLKFMY